MYTLPQDVFTVSVGNLPPGASVLIKITYVAELLVEGENIVFSLPGSVAPWKKDAALDTTTQVSVCVCVCVCVSVWRGVSLFKDYVKSALPHGDPWQFSVNWLKLIYSLGVL